MFDRFTEKAIKVIMHAQEESRRLGHNFVGPEQILLGLCLGGKTAALLRKIGLSALPISEARTAVEAIIGRGAGVVNVEIPFTTDAHRLMKDACAQAKKRGEDDVDEEYLLLALLQQSDTVALQVLSNMGVSIDSLLQETRQMLPPCPDEKS
jgi:ATP-dependent Clp protease ATP-binding subunit ClpC